MQASLGLKAALLIITQVFHVSVNGLASGHGSPISRVTPEDWRALNKSVGGRLFATLPVGLPCYDNFNGNASKPDEAKCDIVEKNKGDMTFFTTEMGGYTQVRWLSGERQHPLLTAEYSQGNWGICQSTGDGCPVSPIKDIDPDQNCTLGNLPLYYINVSFVKDVQEGLRFAAKHKVPIVVKNSGHDYKGRSAGAGSLALWVHNYTPAPALDKDFTPEGCGGPVGDVVTFGTGETFDGAYTFAHDNNVTIVGGSAPTVHPGGGWIAGGGHGGLSPAFGLGVDNVQQLRVVLPSGRYVTANHCRNQDIFFALRGGGGGTFGVIMEMSTLARPRMTMQWANITFANLSDESLERVLRVMVGNANPWFDEGWGGYAFPGKLFSIWLMNPLLNKAAANASLQPLLELAPQLNATVTLTEYESFYELYADNIKDSEVAKGGLGFAQTSRLIPRERFEGDLNQAAIRRFLLNTLAPTTPQKFNPMLLLTTPSRAIQDTDSAVTPAWRKSTWHVILGTAWDPSNTPAQDVAAKFRDLTVAMEPLRYLTPGGGAYINEGDTFEPDHVSAFWGEENYARLLSVKKRVDPHNLMQVYQGVGYDASNPLFDCYPRDQNRPANQAVEMEL